MTRQEKINKVARFCAATDCGNCKAEHMCADVGYGTIFFRWSKASETTLDAMLAAIDKACLEATFGTDLYGISLVNVEKDGDSNDE